MSNMAGIAAMATGAGAGMQTYATYAEGRSVQEQYRQRAKVAMAEADAAQRAGQWEADQALRRGRRVVSQQIVDYAKSGVMASGTPLVVRAKTMENIAKDVGHIGENTALQVREKMEEARDYRKQGARAFSAALWRTGSTLLTGFTNTYQAGKNAGWWDAEKKKREETPNSMVDW